MNILRFSSPLGCNALSSNMFDSLLKEYNESSDYYLPKANVIEEAENFRIELSVPGFAKEQVSLQFKDHVLTVKGNVEENQPESVKYLSREFGARKFVRWFALPKSIDAEAISAAVSNGILTISVPKNVSVEENRVKEIAVQ